MRSKIGLVLALLLWGIPAFTAQGAINAQNLGARYDAAQNNISFRVYSSRATRIEVWIYKTPSGAQEALRYVLTKNASTNVWSKTASVTTLRTPMASPARSITAIAPGAELGLQQRPGTAASNLLSWRGLDNPTYYSLPNDLQYSWDNTGVGGNYNTRNGIETYARRMIAFRKAHPALRPFNFYCGADNNGNVMEQLRWFKPDDAQAGAAYFNSAGNHAIAWRIDGSEFGDPASAIYVAYNGWSGNVNFTLPWPGSGKQWYRVTDTATWNEGPNTVVTPGSEAFLGGEKVYGLQVRSLLLLIAK